MVPAQLSLSEGLAPVAEWRVASVSPWASDRRDCRHLDVVSRRSREVTSRTRRWSDSSRRICRPVAPEPRGQDGIIAWRREPDGRQSGLWPSWSRTWRASCLGATSV
jgi:hypothetical protein